MAKSILYSVLIVSLLATAGFASALTDSLKSGKAEIKSASQLAFGPEGIIFVGDSLQGTLFAILINDIKVNPLSHQAYIAVSRGRGPTALPVILRLDGSGKIAEFSFNNVRFAMVSLPDAPEPKPDAPPGRNPEGFVNGNPRSQTITDMAYVDGKVIVAGLSNEEFNSDLRYVPFPFKNA